MASKSATIWAAVLAGLGVLCLAAAAILAWVVVPERKQLPADTNTVRDFSGTARVLLNPQAIASGNIGSALLTNVPVTAQRTVRAQATDGDAAQVSDLRTVATASGQQLGRTEAVYAVDRKTLEAAEDHPESWRVVDHKGLTVSWPIGAEKRDYEAWVNETQTTTMARYVREETRNGVNTYVYQADAPAAPIKDEQVLSALPRALSGRVLSGLASALPIPDDLKSRLAAALPRLGDQVPLSYTYEAKTTVWVEPATGLVVDTDRQEIRRAGIGTPSLAAVPVYDVTTKFTETSANQATQDAMDNKGSIESFGTTWPLILTIVGVVLLVVALLLALLGRRRTTRPGAYSDGAVPGDRM